MQLFKQGWQIVALLTGLLEAVVDGQGAQPVAASKEISFSQDIRPLLSDRCFHCHGPDEASRKAELRLDTQVAAHEGAIEPGAAAKSELIARLETSDPDDQMPPPDSGVKALSAAEIQLLKDWIDGGAQYETHWAFTPIKRPPLPEVKNQGWVRNSIDHFVLSRLEAEGVTPTSEASPRMLARRVALDLNGLPPSLEQIRSFVENPSEQDYVQWVNHLLASKRFGERMAMVWLDAARYADTDGFQADATRSNWPWRDWVIEAYNNNLPFDQFTLDQFAGDLMPEATPEQILATCFHRNHMANGEGGREPEESRVDYVIDRVNTMGTVWLGLTLGCAQCHNHKFDPISQKEYYQLNAFFNSIDEDGRAGGGAKPFFEYASPFVAGGKAEANRWLEKKGDEFRTLEQATRKAFEGWYADRREEVKSGHQSWHPLKLEALASTSASEMRAHSEGSIEVTGENPRHDDYVILATPRQRQVSGVRLEVLPMASKDAYSEAEDGHVILTNVKFGVRAREATQLREIEVVSAVADYQNQKKGKRDYGLFRDVLDDDPRTGWTTNGASMDEPRVGVFQFKQPVTIGDDEVLVVELRHRSLRGFSSIRHFRLSSTPERGPLLSSVGLSPRAKLAAQLQSDGEVNDELRNELWLEFVSTQDDYQMGKTALAEAKERVGAYERASQSQKVMVLSERKDPRDTHVLVRGIWDQKGELVQRGLPEAFSSGASPATDREALARWLVDRDNPLTARVTVNRYWQMYFGAGLVRTPEDFGLQGEAPTHPELLDWLAVEFIESGWDVKHLQRLIVTSATYRQSSDTTPERIRRDPENRLLSRATRFRLPSWMIRDTALSASGLLVNRLGGPPVYPHQPEGLWADSTMGRFHYKASVGSDLYRRSVYGFWRRSVGPALMFDASKRRVCQVRVTRTSTPLQALTLMNDRTFIEAACRLALDASLEEGEAIALMFERVLSRPATSVELEELQQQFQAAAAHYQKQPKDAQSLLGYLGESSPEAENPYRAAMAVVGMTLLNLDEAITRQ